MAKLFLKDGTPLKSVVMKLKKKGYVVGRQTSDGAFVIYKKKNKNGKKKQDSHREHSTPVGQ